MSSIDIGRVQTIRKNGLKIGALFAFALLMVCGPWWGHGIHRYLEAVGIYLIVLCILGRTLCSAYISGYKNAKIIDMGPYSVCRNPLYVFSFIGAVGVGAMFGSLVISILFGAVTWIVQRVVVAREESYLLSMHGTTFRDYMNKVPRFWPNFSLWKSGETIEVRTHGVLRSFADASLFFLAIPAIEILEYLKESGMTPVLFELP